MFKIIITIIVIFVLLYGAFSWFCIIRDLISKIKHKKEMKNNSDTDKPTRCIDPVIKYCQGCRWGWVHYPEWCETFDDLYDCTFESGCTLGFDRGRPEDEPTKEELAEFEKMCKHDRY